MTAIESTTRGVRAGAFPLDTQEAIPCRDVKAAAWAAERKYKRRRTFRRRSHV